MNALTSLRKFILINRDPENIAEIASYIEASTCRPGGGLLRQRRDDHQDAREREGRLRARDADAGRRQEGGGRAT